MDNKYFEQSKINELFPYAHMYPSMKVWSLPENKKDKLQEYCANGKYFAQLKKDGYWYQFEKTIDESVCYLFSRNTSVTTKLLNEKIANIPHIAQILRKLLPVNTIVIGEIYYPNKTSKDVTTIMNCLPQEAINRQNKKGFLHFYIHDIIMYEGVSLMSTGAFDRWRILDALNKKVGLDQNEFIEIAQIVTENIYQFARTALDNGEEGVVLKEKNTVYAPNKRPAWSTIKIKMIDYADVICIGFCEASKNYDGKEEDTWDYWFNEDTGERIKKVDIPENNCYNIIPVTKAWFYGWKTAIEIGGIDANGSIKKIGTISSGLTEELKKDFMVNPDKYLNKVLMIECMGIDKKEQTFRHGRFKGFRTDKNFQDCLLTEIF